MSCVSGFCEARNPWSRARFNLRVVSVILLAGTAFGASARPPQDIVTGTNTGRETSQTVYGLGDWGSPEVQPSDKAVAAGRKLAHCAVDRRPETAKAALDASDPQSFRAAASRLNGVMEDCLKYGEMALQPSAFAGLLAEAWFDRSGAPSLQPIKYDPNAPKLDFMANGPASLVQLRLGECLASRHPDEVRGLLSAKPGAADEATALGAVIPLISACLDKNVTLQATRTSLRLPLAYALYRRTLNQPPAAEPTQHP